MENVAYSINKIHIRLSPERWTHIVENHDDMAGYLVDVLETVEKPTWVFVGTEDTIWAVKSLTEKKALLVIFKEYPERKDGFIITAFLTSKIRKIFQRRMIWPQPQ